MENFVLLILFTYTGGIMEFVYEARAKGKSFYREPSSALRTARSFFLSLPCAVAALMILKWSGVKKLGNLTEILNTLKGTDALLPFIFWSVGVAVTGGFLWYGARLLFIRAHNWYVLKTDKGSLTTKFGTTWEDFSVRTKENDPTECVAVIYKGGRRVTAGFVEAFSDDFSKDKGIILIRCDDVIKDLDTKSPEVGFIGGVVSTYYNAEVDELIELRAASVFLKHLQKLDEEKEKKNPKENKETAEG